MVDILFEIIELKVNPTAVRVGMMQTTHSVGKPYIIIIIMVSSYIAHIQCSVRFTHITPGHWTCSFMYHFNSLFGAYCCHIGNCPGNPIWLLGYGTVTASVNKANFVEFTLVTFVCCDMDFWLRSHWPNCSLLYYY